MAEQAHWGKIESVCVWVCVGMASHEWGNHICCSETFQTLETDWSASLVIYIICQFSAHAHLIQYSFSSVLNFSG